MKIRPTLIVPEYLAAVLNSHPCYEQSQLHTRGATNQDLGLTRMINIEFLLPSLAEQRAILGQLETRLGQLDEAKRAVSRQRDLLREYRQALITAAVTGKLDVTKEQAA